MLNLANSSRSSGKNKNFKQPAFPQHRRVICIPALCRPNQTAVAFEALPRKVCAGKAVAQQKEGWTGRSVTLERFWWKWRKSKIRKVFGGARALRGGLKTPLFFIFYLFYFFSQRTGSMCNSWGKYIKNWGTRCLCSRDKKEWIHKLVDPLSGRGTRVFTAKKKNKNV